MPTRQVPKVQWADFLTSFANQHSGWLCSIEAIERDATSRRVASDLPLGRIALVQEDGSNVRISIHVGGRGQAMDHAVEAPTEVLEEETAEGVSSGLNIKSSSGVVSKLRFRSPVAPELVDGI